MPTATLEEYLESIYKLTRDGPVRPSRLADDMAVSAPTITATLRRLSDRGLVTRPGGGVSLTASGEREALSILRRHRLAERLLVDVLGLPWDDVHEDACLLEHALSPRVQRALETYLDHPTECPHGHPIPDADLEIADNPGTPLAAAKPGAVVRITAVDESSDAVLAHVAKIGLFPGTTVRVEDVDPFGGALTLRRGEELISLSAEVASRVAVRSADDQGDTEEGDSRG